MGENLKNYF